MRTGQNACPVCCHGAFRTRIGMQMQRTSYVEYVCEHICVYTRTHTYTYIRAYMHGFVRPREYIHIYTQHTIYTHRYTYLHTCICQAEVGLAIKDSGVPRTELYVASKVGLRAPERVYVHALAHPKHVSCALTLRCIKGSHACARTRTYAYKTMLRVRCACCHVPMPRIDCVGAGLDRQDLPRACSRCVVACSTRFLSVCLSVYLSFCLSVCLSFCLSVCLSVYADHACVGYLTHMCA
jgi:hypothetical protein